MTTRRKTIIPAGLFTVIVTVGLFFTTAKAEAALKILKPDNRGMAYDIAADEFREFYRQCTGADLEITVEANDVDDFIVIGSDAVNRFCRDCIEKKIISPFRLRTATDDYHLLSAKAGDRQLLFLAGGQGRSTLYAVYHFFELRGGCSYFWDGDVVPRSETIDLSNLDLAESPRFEYRGIRYFAHRGLTRFQAEHWGPEDWEKEIDWILKRRLNVFMLRIGMDDLFQKAFPDAVPYPDNDKPLPEALAKNGYNDRTTFWSLQYRGELRKHLLQYAFDRELMHPEDFGTVTHWYSRTPLGFLERYKPTFLDQAGGAYREQTGFVWDIRDDRNLDLYFRLTEAHIKYYGRPDLFHTIGLAERRMYESDEDNREIKLYAYRRLIAKLRQHYPNAPLLIAGWDFYHKWTPEEMPALLAELDPEKTIIWDYEADTVTKNNFTEWSLVGKFPYTFGIFESFESAADIRGKYDLLKERIAVAAPDPFCKGYLYWPEVSHADILMLEYFPDNAWKPDKTDPVPFVERLCKNRYGDAAGPMLNAWKTFLPYTTNPEQAKVAAFGDVRAAEYWRPLLIYGYFLPEQFLHEKPDREAVRREYAGFLDTTPAFYRAMSKIPFKEDKPFLRRDLIDLARTTACKLTVLAIEEFNKKLIGYRNGNVSGDDLRASGKRLVALLEGFRDTLSLHEDYSLNASLERLKTVSEVNPCFERALIANTANRYCFSYQYEYFDGCYIPIVKAYLQAVDALIESGNKKGRFDFAGLLEKRDAIIARVHDTPLAEMKSKHPATPERYEKTMLDLARVAEQLLAPAP